MATTTIAFTEGHAAGLAGVAYAGDQVLTCGADCDVRVHGEAAASWDLDESVNCIAVGPDGARFAAGLSDGQVLVRGFPGGEFLSNVTKNTLRVLDLSFSPSGSQMYVERLLKASDRSALRTHNHARTHAPARERRICCPALHCACFESCPNSARAPHNHHNSHASMFVRPIR